MSNPPYLTPEDLREVGPEVGVEPPIALAGGTRLHRELARAAPGWLASGGWLVMEIGASQGREGRDALSGVLEDVQVMPDLAGRDRVVRARRP